MYDSHPLLIEPSDDTVLWRYMDLAKFLALLDSSCLYFSNISAFDDPFEGHPPQKITQAFTAIPSGLDDKATNKRMKEVNDNIHFFSFSRRLICASCWHMNPVENAGMWAQYLKTGEGIAIRTTFGAIKRSLSLPSNTFAITGGTVQYMDYETFEVSDLNILAWGTLKRTGFDHEREFRLLCQNPATGLQVPVSLSCLIENIYVAPSLGDWYLDLVKRVAAKYEVTATVTHSTLLDGPTYIPARHDPGA